MDAAPKTLPENAGLAFVGETVWPAAVLNGRQAQRLMAADNRCGRPNTDVLRRRVAVADGNRTEAWQVDFPGHFTLQEAALYEEPFDHLQRSAPDWKNPFANPDLRRALARVSRYLAMPAHADMPDWLWIEDELIPDASLVVVARDDDFLHGVLSSDAFAAWHRAYYATLTPVQLVESFPFPWNPSTGLSGLTKTQEDFRHAIARAIRADNLDSLHEAVCRAYEWPVDLDSAEITGRLKALHRLRAGS